MKFKFNAGNLQDNGVVAVAGVAGGMASGAVNAITPPKYKTAGKIGHVVLGLVIASGTSGKDTTAKAVQGFGVGLAIRAGYDLAKDQLIKVIPQTTLSSDTRASSMIQGAIGMKSSFSRSIPTHLLGEYDPSMNDNFDFASSNERAKVNVSMI